LDGLGLIKHRREEKRMAQECRICGNERKNKFYQIEERMFGLGESFEYLECRRCGTLQLNTRDLDMGKYYPNYYGAFRAGEDKFAGKTNYVIRRILTKLLVYFNYSVSNRVNRLFDGEFTYLQCFFGSRVKYKSKILDVGCGSGRWLAKLADVGYQNLTGVDLYNHNKIRKFDFIQGDIFSVPTQKKFDVITFHHSFEHMDDPQRILERCRELLEDHGMLIIRIPVMGKYAWKKYGIYWSQIDAPRHLFLYTEKSLSYLLKKCGFRITRVQYDSQAFFQMTASEIYRDTKWSMVMARKRSDIEKRNKRYEKLVDKLNKMCEGDQAIFVIRKL